MKKVYCKNCKQFKKYKLKLFGWPSEFYFCRFIASNRNNDCKYYKER